MLTLLPASMTSRRPRVGVPARRWAGVLLLAFALVWQVHALWRHQLDRHSDAASSSHVCAECLAFAGLDHALPVVPLLVVATPVVPLYRVTTPLAQRAVAPALYQARAPPA